MDTLNPNNPSNNGWQQLKNLPVCNLDFSLCWKRQIRVERDGGGKMR